MVLETTTTAIGTALMNDVSYWLLVIILSFFLFLGLKFFDIPRMYAGITSLLLTVFLLEFFLKALFGILNIPLNFGTYVVDIPFYSKITLTEGVMMMKFLDMVFNFGLFRLVGLPYYESFISASQFVPTTVPINNIFDLIGSAVSSPFNFFVFFYTSVDSVLEYIFFYFFFFAIIVILTDLVSADTDQWTPLAFLLALIPVLVYNLLVSNPVQEYGVAIPEMQKVFYFLGNADTFSIIMFVGTLLVSFLLVMQILAATLSLIYGVGESTIRPDWVVKQWQVSTQGVGFIYTMAFAVMYAMHQYAWYIFFPAMLLYSVFKKFCAGSMDIVKKHNEKQEMADYLGTLVKPDREEQAKNVESENTDIAFWLVFAILLGAIVYVVIQLKWMPFL